MSENESLPEAGFRHKRRDVPGKSSDPGVKPVSEISGGGPHRAFGIEEISGKLVLSVRDALENRRLLIALPFSMIVGILAYRAARFEPSSAALAFVGVIVVAALLFNLRKQALPLLVLFGAFWVGVILLPAHGALFGTGMVRGVFYGTYTAQVDAIHSNDGNRARLIISRIAPVEGARAPPVRRARILVGADEAPRVGATIRAPMRLYKVPGPVVPGGFDSQFQAYFDGIGAFGSVTGTLEVLQSPQSINFFRFVQETREAIGNRIDQSLSPPISGIARALIIGDQGQVDEGIRKNLAASGLAHVLAISGLHLSMVAGGVFAAVRMALAFSYRLGQRLDVKKVAALGGMGAALIYLGLSGASVSAIRATLMLLLVFGAVLAGRRALTMRNVAFAALFVIIIDPASIFRPSFQLSFAAVIALVGAYEGYRRQRSSEEGWLKKLFNFSAGIALTSIIAGAATALFAAYHFQQIAPLGALGNMVAIPLVAFIVLPAALIAVLLMPLGIEPVFLQVMGWGIEQIVAVAAYVAGLSDGFVSAPVLGPFALVVGFLALGWFAFFPGRLRIAGLLAAIPLLLAFGRLPPPDVMIADTTQAVAVREEGGLFLISGRSNTFATNAWGETYLEPITGASEDVNCDALGCIAQRENFILALVKGRDAFGEDCEAADLVVTRIPAPAFCATLSQVIDKDDLEQKGVHWARWTGEEFWIRPAIVDVNRPWRPQY
ncbi:MAG TPA: ComEC family competence protein [Devosia sp.]|nr:ComEC family competence protein [Devosia sp.]